MKAAAVKQAIVDLLYDFIQVWIQQILYQRTLYPLEAFELRKKYDVPTQMSIHPRVNEYVAQFIRSIQPLLEKGSCKSIHVNIASPGGRPLERFVLEVDSINGPMDMALSSDSDSTLADIQHHFRACLLKMNACPSMLSPNPPDCTFTLSMELSEARWIKDDKIQWVPAEQAPSTAWTGLVPLKTIPMDFFRLNTFVLESMKKGKHRE